MKGRKRRGTEARKRESFLTNTFNIIEVVLWKRGDEYLLSITQPKRNDGIPWGEGGRGFTARRNSSSEREREIS